MARISSKASDFRQIARSSISTGSAPKLLELPRSGWTMGPLLLLLPTVRDFRPPLAAPSWVIRNEHRARWRPHLLLGSRLIVLLGLSWCFPFPGWLLLSLLRVTQQVLLQLCLQHHGCV